MIEDTNIEQPQRLFQALGNELVGLAWLGYARWVVMAENHGGGVTGKRHLDHFAGVDTRPVDGSAKKLRVLDHPVLIVEHEASKHFMLIIGHFQKYGIPCRAG